MKRFLAVALILATIGCKQTKKQPNNAQMVSEDKITVTEKTLTVALTPKSDSKVAGTAVFVQKGDKVTLTVHVSGLTAGEHAIHLHEKADCSSPDGTSTGGHWNPTFENHGKWGAAEGFHRGDIGNLTADENGNAHLVFETDLWCIGCEDETKNIVGKAVIIHAAVDDFVTQPTGNAGGRVSCGGIIEE